MNSFDQLNKDVEWWLTKSICWQEAKFALYMEQLRSIEELYSHMSCLKSAFVKIENVQDILKTFPVVGQLLGRLVNCPLLMACDRIFKSVFQCIALFYVETPSSPVEFKAKSWVISQIKHSCCLSKHQAEAYQTVLDITGFSTKEFSQKRNDNSLSTTCFLRSSSSSKSDQFSSTTKDDSIETIKKCEVALQIIEICLELRHISKFEDLLYNMLEFITSYNPENVMTELESLYKKLSQISQYENKCEIHPLSFKVQMLLWCKCNFILENDVLNFVDCCLQLPQFDKQKLENLISVGNLKRACIENKRIYHSVISVLDCLYMKTNNNRIVFMKCWLFESICQYVSHLTDESFEPMAIVNLFPKEKRHLIQLLLIYPNDISLQCCEHHIIQLGMIIQADTSTFDLNRDNLHCFQHLFLSWQFTALAVCLLGSRQLIDSVILLLKLFYVWPSSLNIIVKDFLVALRGLLRKSTLSKTELSYVNESVESEPHLKRFSGQLWMLLLMFGESVFNVYQDILSFVVPAHENYLQMIDTFTETIFIMCGLPVWCRRNMKIQTVLNIAEDLFIKANNACHVSGDTVCLEQLCQNRTTLDYFIDKLKAENT